MSQILHGTTNLIYLPGRTLSRLENGVVQISRTYACRTSGADAIRSLFDVGKQMPGEFGITIKYDYTETERADGFTEFQVTGSGSDPSQPSTGESALKTQDDRTVTTFPSGLVRVERTYICPTKDEARFRPTLEEGRILPYDDGTPAIDGLYIFPTPNEVRRDDGFTEFRVTAYGRTNIFSIDRFQKQAVKETYPVSIADQPTPGGDLRIQEVNIDSLKEVYIFSFVMGSAESTTAILEKPKIDPIVLPRPNYNVPLVAGTGPIFIVDGQGFGYRSVELFLVLDAFNSTNFGRWSEYSVSWKSDARESLRYTSRG